MPNVQLRRGLTNGKAPFQTGALAETRPSASLPPLPTVGKSQAVPDQQPIEERRMGTLPVRVQCRGRTAWEAILRFSTGC